MPTVLRINGYRFYFYSHEPNEPPHIHVDKGSSSLKLGWSRFHWRVISAFARTRLMAY
ncbi:MAG TPA: DUF4160 domain-containing protein [Parasphingorhabdus sp.]